MAATLAGVSFISSSLDLLPDRMASVEFLGNDELLGNFKTTSNPVKEVLDEAEVLQLTNASVKEWLDDLKDVIYYVADFMDEFDYEAWHFIRDSRTRTNSRCQLLSFSSSMNVFKKGPDFEGELRRNLYSLELLIKQFAARGIVGGVGRKQRVPMLERRTNTALEESGHFGREGDDEAVMELISVPDIPLVGIGGMGKTTLGRMLVRIGGMGKTTLCQLVDKDDKMRKGKARARAWVLIYDDVGVNIIPREVLVRGRRPRLHGWAFRKNLPTLERRTSTALSGFVNTKAGLLEFHISKQTRFLHGGSENRTPMSLSTAAGGHSLPTRAGSSINTRLVLAISVALGLHVQLFGYEYVQGNPVPTTAIFKGSPPSLFYAFVACIVFAFTSSFSALMLHNIAKLDKLRRLYSLFAVLFIASAFLILLSGGVLLMGNYHLDLAPVSSIWNMGGKNALFQLPIDGPMDP